MFPGGETTPLFVQSTADRIIALMMLAISMYSIYSLAVRYVDWNVSGFLSSFNYRACNSTYDSTSCIVVLPETRLCKRSVIVSSTKGTLSLDKDNFVLNT